MAKGGDAFRALDPQHVELAAEVAVWAVSVPVAAARASAARAFVASGQRLAAPELLRSCQ